MIDITNIIYLSIFPIHFSRIRIKTQNYNYNYFLHYAPPKKAQPVTATD